MARPRIMVVEDESIVAMDLQDKLRRLHYDVSASVSSGEEAIRKAVSIKPDLVLMDIVLKGEVDGVEAAKIIYAKTGIPVVYLTAYSDESTVQRAKFTEPFGYILKPFEMRDLRTAIDIALYKDKKQKMIAERNKHLALTLESIGNAVVTTDKEGVITYMNPYAEALAGASSQEAILNGISQVFKSAKCAKGSALENLVKRTVKNGMISRIRKPIKLILPEGQNIFVDVKAAPLRDDTDEVFGVVLAVQDFIGKTAEDLKGLERLRRKTGYRQDLDGISVVVNTSSHLLMDGIRQTISSERTIDIVAESSDHSNIIPIVGSKKPDVLIIDVAYFEFMIEDIIDSVKESSAETEIILIVPEVNDQFVINAMSWGVRGIISHDSKPAHLIRAIRTVNKGQIWAELEMLTSIVTRILPSRISRSKSLNPILTNREKEIVKLVVHGERNKTICKKLFISERTVKSHLTNIFKKLGVRNRHQIAIRYRDY